MPRRLDIAQATEHIGKYAGGEEWRAHLDAHVEAMLRPLLIAYDLELQTLFDEVAGLGQTNTLIGFLHESFLAAEFGPDRANVVDAYLKRRGWQETPRAREYLQGIRTTPVSLYEVHAVAPGEWIELTDLSRGGPPSRIGEEAGSRSLQRWDRLAARVVVARGEEMLTGGVLALTRDAAEALERVLGSARGKARRNTDAVFLQAWLKGLLDALRRPLPSLTNTDGEAMVLSRTGLPVRAGAEREITQRLDALPDWERESEDEPVWSWQPGEDLPRTILATARLDGGALTVETNSRERMQRALLALRGILGPLVGEGLTSHEDPVQILRHAAPGGAGASTAEPPIAGPEAEAILRQVKDTHYRRVLDESVPMLGNKTPRQCARTKAGRARLVRWLKELENSERHAAAVGGQAAYDFGWMWHELGLQPTPDYK